MLVTQMNNRDPLNPMDNSQLTSQLAQISTVSSLQTMNTTLNQLLSQNSASRDEFGQPDRPLGGSARLTDLGRRRHAQQVRRRPADGGRYRQRHHQGPGGNVVRTLTLSNKAAGVQDVSWDGKDNNGNTVADGKYTFSVSATAKGNSVSPVALNYATVQSITGDSSGVLVGLTNGQSANVNDIRRIS